jgi:CHAT domain-containing protein/predicted alpha/beta hydrolase family esterase
MATELLIPGRPDAHAKGGTRGAPSEKRSTDLLDAVETVDAYTLSPSARARAKAPARIAVESDDILEIEVEGGFTLWTSVERYRHDLAVLRPEAVRGNAMPIDMLPRNSVSERGVRDWVASALRVLRLRPDSVDAEMANPARWSEFVREAGLGHAITAGAWASTKFALWLIERRLPYGEGLYRFGDVALRSAGAADPVVLSPIDAEQPVLVFIHGAASSSQGSFGALLDSSAQSDWRAIGDVFGSRIYGFEHRTMSASPIENAIRLAQALPARARLSLVTHSRGGLVGDLLCLSSISAEAIACVRRVDPALAEADEVDRRNLQTLAQILAAKQFRIERFVRCASPARGTLLASENTDQFLSVLTNLLGLIPGLSGSPLYEVVKRITLQVAKNRWKPALIPGIEAMTPPSPLVRFLNTQREAAGALGVISGDIEGGHWLKQLGVFLTDQFIYENRDNDLVVNTDSMFEGATRPHAHYVFDQGGDVTHFNYFRNERTRGAIQRWLTTTGEGAPAEFRTIEETQTAPVPMLRALQKRAGTVQPIVFVLPGITGSQLTRADQCIWLDYTRLVADGLKELHDIAATDVHASSLVGTYYRGLCEWLADTHEVIPYAYDWRRSIVDSAARLAKEVGKALERTAEPVRFVAHGMGGLVVRQMIKDAPELWERVCVHEGGRLVMLGTPNHGTHATVDALLGTASTVQQLAMLDLDRGLAGVLDVIQDFPGLLELLPLAEGGRYFERATWDHMHAQCGQGARPDPGRLARARATLAGLPEQIPHAERVLYVAGSSPQTVIGFEGVDGRIVLQATSEGDGRVTYESGVLPGVQTWYLDAEHGDLPATEAGYPAILELLERGTTSRLTTAPPSAARGGGARFRALPQPALYPTAGDLTAGLLGQQRTKRYRARVTTGFRAGVVHGDLRYARYPIVVGHYEGDTIVGAEARIDQLLEGALSTRYNLGLYPGPARTSSVVLRQPTALQRALRLPNGAVVVGLGRWGELTAAQLANLIRRAALTYVLQLDDAAGATLVGESDIVGLSMLLIGTNSTSNISIDDSIAAILRGIAQANRELRSRVPAARHIEEIEIVELYADTAIEAARAVRRLAAPLGDELNTRIEATPLLASGRNGRTRLTPVQGRDSWRRWEISVIDPPAAGAVPRLPKPLAELLQAAVRQNASTDGELVAALAQLALCDAPAHTPHRELKFVSLSDRARAEVLHQQRQPELVERLIAASVAQTRFRAEEARALFELIVPNDLKDGLAQLSRVVFVVDAETAAYPWELMTDGKEPLATRMGLIRQLKTATFRQHIRATTAQTAYIVGDPLVSAPYQQLSGARDEARLVAGLLSTRFEPTYRDEQLSALEVLGGLFEKPYRLIHLAGHGYYEAPGDNGAARSGMVLDNGVYLTAVEIGQMQQVPELVFLNCCHIGQIGPEAPARGAALPYNRLAASISRELIEMGVRAVVAAGWAVRDDAALAFARVFYEQMLEGQSFGRALQDARHRTWQQFPDCNTWGAYQAYGDPDFRLDQDAAASSRSTNMRDYVSTAEFIDVLRDSRQTAREIERGERKGDASQFRPAAARRIADLVKDCPNEWLNRSEVLVELGLAFGELADFEQAARYLSEALASDELDSCTTLAAVERLANFESRLGERLATAVGADAAKRARGAASIETAISRLITLGQLGQTAERLALLAGCYKRLAQIRSDRDEIRLALEQSARHYQKAHEYNSERSRFDPYPVLNWLALDTVLGVSQPELDTLLARVEGAARERYARSKDFFDAVALAEANLVRALGTGALFGEASRVAAEVDRVASLYTQAIRVAQATARQVDSATTQITTLARMLRALSLRDAAAEQTAAALLALRSRISGETIAAAVDQAPTAPASRRSPRKPMPPATSRRRTAAATAAAPKRRRRNSSGISG